MTENMAARGEGLAGLVAKWRERAISWRGDADLPKLTTEAVARGWEDAADELEAEIAALEAAAPAGTAPPELLCVNCGHSYAQHTKGINHPQKYCRHCPCLEWAALATPSPQAPQQESSFSPTSAREQSSATASDSLNVTAQEILKPHWPSVRNMEENEARQKEVERIAKILQRREEVRTRTPDWQERPAATQEQPAGSEAILRCMERHPEGGQCELRRGHARQHLAGMIMWGSSSVPVGEQKQEEGV